MAFRPVRGRGPGGVNASAVPTDLGSHNPRIAAVRALQTAAGRREQGAFAIEGTTMLAEAERSGVRLRAVYGTAQGLDHAERDGFAARAEAAGVPVFRVADSALARMSGLTSSPGILAVVERPQDTVGAVLARPGPVLLLAAVNDPGNAGTLVRSAEAFGTVGVLFGDGGADPFGPKVVRASMGSIFRVPVASVGPDEIVAAAAATGRPLIVADREGEELHRVALPPDAIVAVGNERHGVRGWLPRWDRAVRIPQRDAAESLNAAVAGSILLYELGRVK